MLTHPSIATLNHLLTQSGWACRRLIRFSGKTVRFNIAPFSLSGTLQDDGTLREAAADLSADASCTFPISLLPRLILRDKNAFDQIESCGDGDLLTEIFFLFHNLQWDVAEDLSHFTGDVAAERVVQFAKAKHQLFQNMALNLSQAIAEYWTEEAPLLAKPSQLANFSQEVSQLRDKADQLEQRLNQLSPPP